MFRLPKPDMSINGAGGPQGSYDATSKNVQTQQGEQSFTNTIFASLDGDKNSSVTKTEAQPQINQGFNINLGALKNEHATKIFSQWFGTSDLDATAKSIYNEMSNKFKAINSGKMDVAQAETAQAQQQLDTNTNAQINEQIKNINASVQNIYTSMLNDANQQADQEEQNLNNPNLNKLNDPTNNLTDLNINNQDKENEFASRGEVSLHGANVRYTTESGTQFSIGKKGASLQSGNWSMNTDFNKVSTGYNKGNFSVSVQQNLKNGSGSLNISYRFKG